MTEIAWLIELFRTLLAGEAVEPLFQKPGFVGTMIWTAAIVPPSLIAVGIGMHEWGETPIGRWFGISPSEPTRSLGEINSDLRKYETWRDLDGDGEADF